MAQVSKYPLKKEVKERIEELLWEVIGSLKSKQETEKFFRDLLSPTEEIMLSKRLAIALMLLKKYDYRTISDILKVSTGTVGKISLWLKHEGEGYRRVLEKIIAKEKWEELWEKIDEGISRILPPKGKDWKIFYSERAKAKVKSHRPF